MNPNLMLLAPIREAGVEDDIHTLAFRINVSGVMSWRYITIAGARGLSFYIVHLEIAHKLDSVRSNRRIIEDGAWSAVRIKHILTL
ncbi:hypothetical protein D3C78_1068150 [compost metagenome]